MNEFPLVTVNILSFNRKDELRNTLTKVYEQDYKNIEVIVVDNASSDGSPEMVKEEFPDVILIKLDKNIGIAGWNRGFEVAKGEYILVLDDDSYPEKTAIGIALKKIQEEKSIGIIAFDIFNIKYNFSETNNYPDNPWSFTGCGALISKELLNKIGFYNSSFFIYLNELDFSCRTYNVDWKILYVKEAKVTHNQSLISRGNIKENPFASKYRYHFFFVNMSLFLFLHFSLSSFLFNFFRWIINRFLISLRFLYLFEFIKGFLLSIFYIIKNIKKRHAISEDIQKFYNFGKVFPIIDREFFSINKE